jgi:hypothetical protein
MHLWKQNIQKERQNTAAVADEECLFLLGEELGLARDIQRGLDENE